MSSELRVGTMSGIDLTIRNRFVEELTSSINPESFFQSLHRVSNSQKLLGELDAAIADLDNLESKCETKL